jgi:hypothetical protein
LGIVFVAKNLWNANKGETKQTMTVQSCSAKVIEKNPSGSMKEDEINAEKSDYVVYYFHNSIRCSTCRKIEKNTRELFEQKFKDKYVLKVFNI